jgi:acyl-CoA dehydrogenase
MGWHSSNTAELVLDEVRVPDTHLVGEENRGFYYIMTNFQNERLAIMGAAIGECQKAIDLTIDYVKARHAFGGALWNKQAVRQKMEMRQAEVDAGRELIYKTAWMLDQASKLSAKSRRSRRCGGVVEPRSYDCVQLHGGMGMWPRPRSSGCVGVRINSIGGAPLGDGTGSCASDDVGPFGLAGGPTQRMMP